MVLLPTLGETMNVHCNECGQRVNLYEDEKIPGAVQLCVACFVAWQRLSRTVVTFRDLDEMHFDPPLTDLHPSIAERIKARADQTRLP